jgi:hypothetical protein
MVVPWRAGPRICEALTLAEADPDRRRGLLLVRRGKRGRRREVGIDDRACGQLEPWLQTRGWLPIGPLLCVVNGRAPPADARARPPPPARSCAASPVTRVRGGASPRTSSAHAHAVGMAREGVPLIVIQRQLGPTPRHHLGLPRGIETPGSSTPSTRVARRWSPYTGRSRRDAATGGGEADDFLAAGPRPDRQPETPQSPVAPQSAPIIAKQQPR